jgi:hypothetical protein
MVDSSFSGRDFGATTGGAERPAHPRRLHLLLFVLFLSGSVALLIRGWDFYQLSVGARVDHPDFRVLAPGSNLGHGYGIAGTALILTNLAYLLRRKFPRLSLGSLRVWLDIHVFTGLFGGMLVLFHSAFQARSTMAVITVGSLLVVIGTGLLGRYLYALSPRPDRERLERALSDLNVVGPGLGQELRLALARVPVTGLPERPSLLALLALLPSFRRELRQRRAVIDAVVTRYRQSFGPELALLSRPLADCTRVACGEVRAAAAGALVKSWRGLHRFAALLMVSLVALHIGVAWYYGFVWVFHG